MKILIIADSLEVGVGSDKFAAILGSELHTQGYHVFYLTLMDGSPKYNFKGDYYTLNEDDIYGNDIKRGFNLLRNSSKVKKICEDLDIDVMISAGDPANFYAILSRWLYGNNVRIIISQHMNPEIFLDSPLKYRLIKFFFPHADEIVCVSRGIESTFNEVYGFNNALTIYNMMDIEENLKLSVEKLPDQYKDFFQGNENEDHGENLYFNFINLGRLDRQKGQWFLIRSFRRVVDKYKNARLFILGEGDLREKLEGLIDDLDLNENVFLLGEQENVFPFLKNSDCFILSSLWEGFGLVLVEALSMDLPIISTDCKVGPREVLCPELDLEKSVNYPFLENMPFSLKILPTNLYLNL
jgi:glycosyltransferase involved in cell wall biosynthesis